MKYVIHKFHLDWTGEPQEIEVPIGSRIVHVANQYDRPTVWVEREVSPFASNHLTKLHIKLVATGEEFERTRTDSHNEAIYLGTTHVEGLVWHFYQVREIP